MTTRREFLGHMAASTALLSAPSWAQQKGTFKVGVLIALSGAAAAYGAEERRAIEAEAARVNAAGGIRGRNVEIIVRDTKTNPTEAARLANQLIADDGVVALIGASTGSETLAFADTAMRAKVPIFPMVGTQSVTDPAQAYTKWIFRNNVAQSTDVIASYKRLVSDGKKRVAVFYQEDAYGQQGADMMKAAAKRDQTVEIVESVSAPANATDLTTPATRIRNSNPDAVFLVSAFVSTAGNLLRKLDQVGLTVPVYSLTGIVQKQIITTAGKAAELLIAPAMVNPFEPGPIKPLFDLMKDHGGVEGFGSLVGANAMTVVIAALQSGATDGSSVRDAVETLGPIKGYAAAPVHYTSENHDGWGADTMFFVTVRDGQFKNL